ncbi:heme exporter membrane protein [Deferribacter desulfuricans SSM1]|uniref:Heme exporter protein C n=1 Tax=Deferribacter desulfuricans (strain DSM 14783 / JCM 11476 / NBRC 101012 / SSM1) TaxID=639282 RepID=D3PAR6_DEFDS|nr:cytochrome c biogenesis protein CcsA [Deferribacter desulfuricans]BAI79689.1 heme exporter membrane protein [Deferribacter desulfuricans SSM1]
MNVLDKFDKLISILTFILISVALYFAFIYAPVEKVMGIIQKIFYFHVASAWIAFFAFFITFLFSILVLINEKKIFDEIAASSAEIGIVFCTIVLITGPIWARPVWGVWWTWDPRLTTTLVLWFIYVGYLMLRKFVDEDDKKAKFSAVVGVVGFIDVPIVFMSIRWWRTIHPNVLQKGGGGLHPDMLIALIVSVIAFTFLYLALMIKRVKLGLLADRVLYLQSKIK